MESERMLVIANSRKDGGHCVAGVTLEEPRLVRPVSGVWPGGALSGKDCRVDGHTPKELEIITFTHEGSQKDRVQPENVVIDGTPWETEGLADPEEALEALLEVVEEGPMLFGNRGRAVPEHVAAEGMDSSLAVIVPARLRFGRGEEADAHARSPRAVFKFCGEDWSLPVTDFEIGPKILNLPEGLYSWEDLEIEEPEHVLLSVSLGTAHQTWHSKLVAGVLRLG
jgi:hypothetical protein